MFDIVYDLQLVSLIILCLLVLASGNTVLELRCTSGRKSITWHRSRNDWGMWDN